MAAHLRVVKRARVVKDARVLVLQERLPALVSNALQYSRGGGTVRLSLQPSIPNPAPYTLQEHLTLKKTPTPLGSEA